MKLRFTKMHGLGNDFIVINNLDLKHQFTIEQIRLLADRKLGVGCDQLLLIDSATDGESDFFYRIYNSDGSIAGQCGNGARCFIRYVVERQLTAKSQIQLQTAERIISGAVLSDNLVEVDMGKPNFMPSVIPLNHIYQPFYQVQINQRLIEFSAVSMGNPHAVIRLHDNTLLSNDAFLAEVAIYLQQSSLFPQSVNVNFIVIEQLDRILLRTYERGCGFTLACGSGACASAAVAIQNQWVKNQVGVFMPGGDLTIKWSGENLIMRGTATFVFDGELEL